MAFRMSGVSLVREEIFMEKLERGERDFVIRFCRLHANTMSDVLGKLLRMNDAKDAQIQVLKDHNQRRIRKIDQLTINAGLRRVG